MLLIDEAYAAVVCMERKKDSQKTEQKIGIQRQEGKLEEQELKHRQLGDCMLMDNIPSCPLAI